MKIFGQVVDGSVELSRIGRIAADEWARSTTLRPEVVFDEWIVMPNHLHAIVALPGIHNPSKVTAAGRARLHRPGRSLASLIAGFKASVTGRVRGLLGDPEYRVWQYKYYEHGIRCPQALERIREYIHDNLAQWADDPENVQSRRESRPHAVRPYESG